MLKKMIEIAQQEILDAIKLPPSPFEADKTRKERKSEELSQSVAAYGANFEKGALFFVKELSVSHRQKIEQLLNEGEEVAKRFRKGETLQSLLEMTNEEMEGLYQKAIQLFSQDDHGLTKAAFTFLSALNPTLYHYWLGLAAAEYRLGNIQEAENLYNLAMNVGIYSPEPFYYAARFYTELRQMKKARELYEIALEKTERQSIFAPLRAHILKELHT